MIVLIRTDSSIQIGSGHVMRCLTLAKQLRNYNVKVYFICRELEGNMVEYIRKEGFEVFVLTRVNTALHWEWVRDFWLEDAMETIDVIAEIQGSVDMVIVDHYSIDFKWEGVVRPYTEKMMIIDDLADRKHDTDLLLDQNYYNGLEQRYDNMVAPSCKLLLGPNFLLLREEFLLSLKTNTDSDTNKLKILLFFGGTDPTGETLKVLKAISEIRNIPITMDVIIGEGNPDKQKIEILCRKISDCRLYSQVNNMSELIQKADVGIGAGGTNLWERCILKLPSLVIITAKNQEEVVNAVSEQGSIYNLGYYTEISNTYLKEKLINFLSEKENFENMKKSCGELLSLEKIKKQLVCENIMIKIRARGEV
ncbi:UDP-2,4-diacetamido-2,4,6-trideoxy-beta-L-altropyranose hydrolase [Lysinibacillus sp. G4S2]|uniref:UDP-2,4-diacetamido-2,4, 6-trideoxy-beta-L-altropyranose hydrolase n=1 Tax=Lysinibacillus sp. G4S2 TaxID=3055859 RepID=UPI0025A0E128|nr:UDP-2,4-diacetamido-2,4,6-trideoxy-beta-L-altropyranose hydrolase [Lysinibacillus sp. G4S2]MDM5246500.1 UDP-2,4-diacetamido-2,4,6-trideoxy-beta-L-altropyranose hydrolase [Lysinibacillus sp. G4S2]